ncbi:hypothetical protein W97_02336 [Coniosporium apollinis CBS 100218]|uniref:Thymidylate kinase protein n=1 Tax=Coniosporium apollinis (strain CBS 100218) TaxID=1168221 RepID=R7YMU1_CONA1|nr:uncharacterized protein W97_02336 [Coniosporium apollinis CBS 100218]EON63109.1 hypothetical protein W97_02336 [Coniosporium apollinis CBS 100218]
MAATVRQPLGGLDATRLQSITSMKNRQNAIVASLSYDKSTLSSPAKRRYEPSSFDDENDSENIDPSLYNSPSKRSKNLNGTPQKASKFVLTDAVPFNRPIATPSSTRFSSVLSRPTPISLPVTTSPTPINVSRGSPKNKRVGILSNRRKSSSPYTRVDPPSYFRASRTSSSGLPFSIDDALSGTISSYTPKSPLATPPLVETPTPATPAVETAMPKSWFFEIHEDTPEEEATNLLEHSAVCLDISSDDDCETKRKDEDRERGKENIPPPDFLAGPMNTASGSASLNSAQTEAAAEPVKLKSRRHRENDAMDEDRVALGDLPAAEYYGEGLDASSYVFVDGTAPEKPSGLSKECKDFDFEASADASAEASATEVKDVQVEEVVPQDAGSAAEVKVFEEA